MRFLADGNVSPAVTRSLRRAGHNVRDVKEEGWHERSDEWVMRRARRERRVVISEDLDFGNLTRFPLQKHAGAMLLHFPDMRPREVAARLRRFLAGSDPRRLRGAVVFLEEGRFQIVTPRRR